MTRRLVVSGGSVLAPDGMRFLREHSVVCDGDRVVAVAAGEVRRSDDTVVDATGSFVVPGLIDAHFHLVSRSAEIVDDDVIALGSIEGVRNAAERLDAGVTAVRDAGCRHHGIFALARAIESGVVSGPRTFPAGRNPTGPGAPAHWRNVVVRNADEMRHAVSSQLDSGATWVKCVLSHAEDPTEWDTVSQYLGEKELRAAVGTAHARDARISVHCEGADIAAMAVRCGVDALEHAPLLDERTAETMAERGIAYVPTVWAFSDDSGIDLEGLPPARRARLLRWRAAHLDSVARAHQAGVVIAAGSDAAGSLPARDVLVRELEALTRAGLDDQAALASATSSAARVVGAERQLGAVLPGCAADLVVLADDPLRAIAALRTPEIVISRGVVVAGSRAPRPQLPTRPHVAIESSTDRWAASRERAASGA